MKQNENRSELQKRLDAELRAKAAARSKSEDFDRPDGVDDSAYIKGTKQTSSLAWAWLLIFFAVMAILGFFIYTTFTANSQ